MSSRSFIAAIATVSVSALSVLATAQASELPARKVTVSLERFDLSKQAGADSAYASLRRAARVVCAPFESRELKAKKLHRQCFEDALANAVADIDSPRLTALHQSDPTLRLAASSKGADADRT